MFSLPKNNSIFRLVNAASMISGPAQFTASLEDYMLPCLNKQLLGVECPGCGLQRAVLLLFRGEFIDAFYMYPAVYSLILLFGFLLADQFFTIRHANKISIILMLSSVFLILAHYIANFF